MKLWESIASVLLISSLTWAIIYALESRCQTKTCKTPGTHRALVHYQCVCVGDEE